MQSIALAYHDIVDGDLDASGFRGPGPANYKIDVATFREHVEQLAAVIDPVVVTGAADLDRAAARERIAFLTFDDGGISASSLIADVLEANGMRGMFFIATDYIGTDGFISATQLRDLHARGHAIGSHSRTHPANMRKMSTAAVAAEWRDSIAALRDLTGSNVATGSVPRGQYDSRTCETAAAAGIEVLFTSDPRRRITQVGGCRLLGRFALRRGDSAARAVALASSSPSMAQLRQRLAWDVKAVGKRYAGNSYERFRQFVLRKKRAARDG